MDPAYKLQPSPQNGSYSGQSWSKQPEPLINDIQDVRQAINAALTALNATIQVPDNVQELGMRVSSLRRDSRRHAFMWSFIFILVATHTKLISSDRKPQDEALPDILLAKMKFTIQKSTLLALVSGQLVHGWNMTIYDSENCTGRYYEVYPTAEYTKYFEMEGSWGAEMVCTFHDRNDDRKKNTEACQDQIPAGKSVFSAVGRCRDFSGPHSSGAYVEQKEGECKTTAFDILSVVCRDS
ncbi:hypothetical protein GGR50DRAFT_699850 [Xylaria sp. CBS 124048]|nr:hypothetical protein GGR50DRAFT_699850 [Xylaria sp. CBS 124048]